MNISLFFVQTTQTTSALEIRCLQADESAAFWPRPGGPCRLAAQEV